MSDPFIPAPSLGAEQIEAKYQQALSFHQHGRLAEAVAIYDEILVSDPQHFDTLHLRGVLAFQTGDAQLAVDLIGKAIALFADDATFYCNLGNAQVVLNQRDAALASYNKALEIDSTYAGAYFSRGNILQQMGDLSGAVASFDKAVEIHPDFAEAHLSRGNVFQQLQRYPDAVASYNHAIASRPDLAEAFTNRGIALVTLNDLKGALESYDMALRLQPGMAEIYTNRGVVLAELKRFDDAMTSFEQAIALQPQSHVAHLNLSYIQRDLKHFAAALKSLDHVIALQPDFANAHFYRGNMLYELQEYQASVASYDRAVALDPTMAEAFHNQGLALTKVGNLSAAIASYDRSIALNPMYAEAYSNRGLALHELMHIDKAIDSYDKAIAIKHGYVEAQWNKSLSLLMRGNYHDGWRLFEFRRTAEVDKHLRDSAEPLWLGQASLSHKTILIHSEQGLGDTLQFCRYVKFLAALGAFVILEVERGLVNLLSGLDGVGQVVRKGDALPPFDYQCPMMSLPHAFKTDLTNIPSDAPYIRAPADQTTAWRDKLGPKTKPRVGLVWHGGLRSDPAMRAANARRNVPLPLMATLNNPSIEFYSLQKGATAESELAEMQAELWPAGNFRNFAPELHDFADTAALVANLDLVISVDTSTAHLVGAMGKPVWILNRFDTCWRWMEDRTDSPWYPSAKLYRQPAPGDWASVLARVRDDLAKIDLSSLR